MNQKTFTEMIKKIVAKHGAQACAMAANVRTPVIEAWCSGVGPHRLMRKHIAEQLKTLILSAK